MNKHIFLCAGLICLLAFSQLSAGQAEQDTPGANDGALITMTQNADATNEDNSGTVEAVSVSGDLMESSPAIDCPCRVEPDFEQVNDSPDMPPVLQYPFTDGACAQLAYKISFGGYGSGDLIGLMIRCFGELQAYPAY